MTFNPYNPTQNLGANPTAWQPLDPAHQANGVASPAPTLQRASEPMRGSVVGSPALAGPLRRYTARTIDLIVADIILYGVVLCLMTFGLINLELSNPGESAALHMTMLPIALLVDAAIYRARGTTLGKKLLGIRVVGLNGSPLTPRDYAWRNVRIWIHGFGFGIPVVSLVTLWRQYRRVRAGGCASYDVGRDVCVERA